LSQLLRLPRYLSLTCHQRTVVYLTASLPQALCFINIVK
jgi:hypothetical protein